MHAFSCGCWRWLVVAPAMGLLAAQPPDSGGDKPKQPATNLDQQLFDDLAPRKAARPPVEAPAGQTGKPKAGSGGEDLGAASGRDSRLLQAAENMRRVESMLRQGDASDATRGLQEQIAKQLERLLDEQQRRPEASPAPAHSAAGPQTPGTAGLEKPSAKPGSERQDPGTQGPGTASDAEMTRAGQAVWGMLPDRVRQRIQGVGNEEFLPPYAGVIREYFERLAERGSKKP